VRRLVPAIGVAVLAIGAGARVAAHDIPRDVVVHVWLKPEGGRLRVLARAPLGAMRDIQFPQRSDGNLDVARAQPLLRDAVALWIASPLRIHEDGAALPPPQVGAVRVSLPSDRSFSSFDTALAHVTQPAPEDPSLPWSQASLDVLLEYPISSDRSRFSIRPGFERLGVTVVTVLRLAMPDGAIRAFELRGDPGLVELDPRWHEAAWRFVKIGFRHILDGADHLLFLFCLVIPFRRLRPLILVVTAFTAAHSIALLAAAYGFVPDALWFTPLVETLIAASVLYMAIENIVSTSAPTRRMWMAFGFGLVHGFGFSFALGETMQFAGTHLLTSLFAFNVGVEIGQVLVLAVLVPALWLLFRTGIPERVGVIVMAVLAGHVAWHWMAERWAAFREFPLPALDAALGLVVVRGLIVAGVVAFVVLAGRKLIRKQASETP
jgi:hypothetical protein